MTSAVNLVNSTTYIDAVGLLMGESRLPGEPSSVFLRRLERLASSRLDHSYKGTLNQISNELGFTPTVYFNIVSTIPNSSIVVNMSGVTLVNAQETVTIPIITLGLDSVIKWRKISDICSDINNLTQTFSTTLIQDGLGLELANQNNQFAVLLEPIINQTQALVNSSYVLNSGFMTDGSSFTVNGNVLMLTVPPSSGATFNYQYNLVPYGVVGCPVSIFGLLDTGFSEAVVNSEGQVAYQVLEIINAVFQTDSSYWAK